MALTCFCSYKYDIKSVLLCGRDKLQCVPTPSHANSGQVTTYSLQYFSCCLRCLTISTASVNETVTCFSLTSLSSCKAVISESPLPIHSCSLLSNITAWCKNVVNIVYGLDSDFIRYLFPENLNTDKKSRPTTAGSQIKVRMSRRTEDKWKLSF